MNSSVFSNFYIKFELYSHIPMYQYTKIHVIELEIPKYGIRFLFNYLIVRKIGISCEFVGCLFFPFFYNSFMFIQQNASCTFHQYEYLLVADTFTYTF